MNGMPARVLLAAVLCALLPAFALADVPNRPKEALHEAIVPHGVGAARGWCSILYWNICSGWTWRYSDWQAGDEVGVIYDLPEDCGVPPGSWGDMVGLWWYWRSTRPGWGYTVSYTAYRVDADNCKVGGSLHTVSGHDPTERWNYIPSWDFWLPGACRLALAASWEKGGLPHFCTDNNERNLAAPNACPNYEVGPERTFYWGGSATQYCPPLVFSDAGGPVDAMADASFWFPDVETEPSSWGRVKALFR
jgi:hypothetical protein